MKALLQLVRAAMCIGVVAGLARAVAACAADGAAAPDRAGDTPDAGPDAATPDAAIDAADGGVDAAIPVPACSVDGWCYSALPAATSFDAGPAPADPNGFTFSLQSVWMAPDHHAWAVGSAGQVLHWDGASWKVDLVTPVGLHSIWGASATDLWIAGDEGLLLHATGPAGSLSFAPVSLGTAQSITRVWGTSAGDVWVIAGDVHHRAATTDAGAPFAPVNVPSPFGAAAATKRITAIWGSTSSTWFGGIETSFCAPPSCTTATELFVTERKVDGTGTETWSTLALPIAETTALSAGLSTDDGLQIVSAKVKLVTSGIVARVADDPSQLEPARGTIHVDGAHAWSSEIAEQLGWPEALWGHDKNDLWLVGQSGVVRNFDGKTWKISRVARTSLSPLVNDLRAIDAVVDPATGARDMWIVGDDVALHRTVKP